MSGSVEAPELARAVTPVGLRSLPVHRWGRLAHSFGPTLVTWAAQRLALGRGSVVLDPFVGAGTTLVTGRELGWRGVGLDRSPWAAVLTRTKAVAPGVVSGEDLVAVAKAVQTGAGGTRWVGPADEGVAKALFAPAIVAEAARIAGLAADEGWGEGGTVGDLVFVALAGALARHGLLERKGGWLAGAPETVGRHDPERLRADVAARLAAMADDLERTAPAGPPGVVVQGDARALPLEDGSVDAVVTSPPYPNRHDYSRAYALELAWLADDAAVRRFRREHFASHPEVAERVGVEVGAVAVEAADAVRAAAEVHRPRSDYVGRVLVPRMLAGYGADALVTARELARVVRPGGAVVVVVANASYCGVEYPTDLVWAEALGMTGFSVEDALVARQRPAATQQRAAGLVRDGLRESVVVGRA